jgi:hypothetical protein
METITRGILRVAGEDRPKKFKLEFLKKETCGEEIVFVNCKQIAGKAMGIELLDVIKNCYRGKLDELRTPPRYRFYCTRGISGRQDDFIQVLSDFKWGNTETYSIHWSMFGNLNEGIFYPLFALADMVENEFERLNNELKDAEQAIENFKKINTDDEEDKEIMQNLLEKKEDIERRRKPFFSNEYKYETVEEIHAKFEPKEVEPKEEKLVIE